MHQSICHNKAVIQEIACESRQARVKLRPQTNATEIALFSFNDDGR